MHHMTIGYTRACIIKSAVPFGPSEHFTIFHLTVLVLISLILH